MADGRRVVVSQAADGTAHLVTSIIRRFKPEMAMGGATASTTLSYVAADVGLALKF